MRVLEREDARRVIDVEIGLGVCRRRRQNGTVAARHGRERLMLLARNLRRVGPAAPLELEVFADRVGEIAHDAEA